MTNTEKAIISAINRYQPCSQKRVQELLDEHPPGTVLRYMQKLASEGKIVNHTQTSSAKGRWAIAGVHIDTPEKKKKSKPAPPPVNVVPGRLVSKMDGVWVPPKTLLRHDAQDSNACMSLDQGVRKPYTGRPLTLGVRVK